LTIEAVWLGIGSILFVLGEFVWAYFDGVAAPVVPIVAFAFAATSFACICGVVGLSLVRRREVSSRVRPLLALVGIGNIAIAAYAALSSANGVGDQGLRTIALVAASAAGLICLILAVRRANAY
jgi:hypothetical protein